MVREREKGSGESRGRYLYVPGGTWRQVKFRRHQDPRARPRIASQNSLKPTHRSNVSRMDMHICICPIPTCPKEESRWVISYHLIWENIADWELPQASSPFFLPLFFLSLSRTLFFRFSYLHPPSPPLPRLPELYWSRDGGVAIHCASDRVN